MTSILRDWLTSVNIECQRDEKLEDIFSNGYLIGQLLCNLEIGGLNEELFLAQFVNDESIDAITINYKLIALYLCEGGVNIKSKLLQDIANNISGAIHRFIYDVKCFIDSQLKDTTANITRETNIPDGITGLNEGTSSFKAPPRITSPTRIRKYAYEDMLKRDVELKIRKLATEKFLKRSELKFEKYRNHRTEIEETAKSEQEFEKQLKNERTGQRHDILVQTLKENHLKRVEDDKFSKEKWIKNQKIKKQRICEKKHFQKTQHLKQLQKENIEKKNVSNQIIKCLDEFETILSKTQKLQKNENQEIKASELQKNEEKTEREEKEDETAVKHLEKLRNKLPNNTISMKETEKYLKQIKINVYKQKQEGIKREQRRKKLISDEIEINKEKEQFDRKTEINSIINHSNDEFENKIKSIKLHKKIFKQNAKLFAQKENERKEKDEKIKLNRDRKHFEIKKIEFKTKLSIENRKLKELKLKETQYQHVQNTKYCKTLVEKMVGITYKSVLYRQLSQEDNIPTQLWTEWMQLLNNNNKNNNNKQHILSNIDMNAKHEELDKELNDILLKEKECHAEIIRIKNGLIECMDINGEINKKLINKTELNNYLNGKGIWKYDVVEPTTDNLGEIIEEIAAISRGEEPKHEKSIPDVPICIAFIGKPFVGKTTQAQQVADRYALQIIEPEKCIKDAIKSFDEYTTVFATDNELSRQQQIGERLKNVLQDGKEVDDELYIDVIFDAILSGKDEQKMNGWILDGFPNRKSQAELLENKLSGYVVTPSSKKKASKIAPPDDSDIEKIQSGLDFVFYLDVEETNEVKEVDTILLNRANGRIIDEESGRVYHITQNPPPHDQCIKEGLKAASDEEYVAGLPEHFKAWEERKDELADWFNKFGIWRELNCNQDRNTLTLSLIEIIKQQINIKKEKEKKEEEEQKLEPQTNEETAENIENENKNQEEKEELEKEEEENNKLSDEEIYGELHYFWSNFEELYIDNITSTFESLRHERRRILAYLASTREYFYNFLRTTDDKQSIIDNFQNEYNNNTDSDQRCNDDTKEELHQQVKELSFKLFQYSMEKKNKSIQELNNIKNSIWLKKENNILLKSIINIIQYELNRYISTIRVIKDYFSLKNEQKMCEKPVEQIDLFTIIDQNKKLENENDKLQNAIDIALKYINDNGENDAECQVINDENARLKMRLQRLNKILNFYLQDVSHRHNNLLQKMDEWIGFRINSENEAIDSLVNHIEQCIENECQLHYRLILDGENFLIDQDVIVCPMPNPIQKISTNHQFTIAFTAKQIKQFIKLLQSQNVSGIIEYKTMYEILERLSNNTNDVDNETILPKLWQTSLNDKKIDLLLSSVVIIGCDKYVNWKLFVVSLIFHTLSVISNTIIIPSLDTLFDLKQAFNAKDTNNSSKLNEKEFGQVLLWFDKTANNVWQNILFDLFKSECNVNEINYNELLYHLCFNDESHFGFEKIVSLSQNLNIIQDTTNITDSNLQSIQMRGIKNVEIENVNNISQIFNFNQQQLTMNIIKQNNQILKSFNLINIQQILTTK